MIKRLCPAKINLGLAILGERPDGYHELATIFYKLPGIADELQVQPAQAFSFVCSEPKLEGAENLVHKAAARFCEAAEIPPKEQRFKLRLTKHIPMGAGLGGGSSNAAAALLILNDYFGSPLTGAKLHEIAAKLGADVPFFLLRGNAAYAEGIGEKLRPMPLSIDADILVAKFRDIDVPTGAAYAAKSWPRRPAPPLQEIVRMPISQWPMLLSNDFEEMIFDRHPKLAALKARMLSAGAAYAAMSGSGSSIFGLFPEPQKAENLQKELSGEGLFAELQKSIAIRAVG